MGGFKGPENCKDSVAPAVNVSHGDLFVTAITDGGVILATGGVNGKQ